MLRVCRRLLWPFGRAGAERKERERTRIPSYRKVAAYRLVARMHCFAKWKSSVHFKSSEAPADCAISIGVLSRAAKRARDVATLPATPSSPFPFLSLTTRALISPRTRWRRRVSRFNGQIARFVRGNRISIVDQLLTFSVPIREMFVAFRNLQRKS